MKKIFFPLFLVPLLMFCSSCNKEEDSCVEPLEAPTEYLSSLSTDYISNYNDPTKIIFTSDLNEEVTFAVSSITTSLNSYSGSTPCEEDSTRNRVVTGQTESMELSLSNVDLPQPIIIKLTKLPVDLIGSTPSEEMLIRYASSSSPVGAGENLMVHYTQESLDFTVLNDSLLIGNTYFYDVLEVNPDNPGFTLPSFPSLEVKYSKSKGLIYINDKINNRELFYDRTE